MPGLAPWISQHPALGAAEALVEFVGQPVEQAVEAGDAVQFLGGRLEIGGHLPAAVDRPQGRHGPHQGAAGIAEAADAAPEAAHQTHGLGRYPGVDGGEHRLQDALGAVQAGFEVGLGPSPHPGYHFFRLHWFPLISKAKSLNSSFIWKS